MNFKDLHSENNVDIYKTGVYTIEFINKPGLYYVGSTKVKGGTSPSSKGFYVRWHSHFRSLKNGDHPNSYLQRIVNKHGLLNLRFKILETANPELVRYLEIYWINMLNSNNSKYGYNTGHVSTKNVRFKISQETKDKISKAKSKKVLQYSYDGYFIKEYPSCKNAGENLKIDPKSIADCCIIKQKSRKSCAGFLWEFKTENFPLKIDSFYPCKARDDFKKKKVAQFDIETRKIIKIFDSLTEAVDFLKCERGNLIRILKRKHGGRSGNYRGYYWEYYGI